MASRHISQLYLAAAFIVLIFSLPLHASRHEGSWSGRIDVPGNPIEIAVDLAEQAETTWRGQIDIPAQGLTAFPLADIEVDGVAVTFAMSGIPGDPVFRGEISKDGVSMSGEFSQGDAAFPFQLVRRGDARLKALSSASSVDPDLAATLAGRWEGRLEVSGQSLRLVLDVANGSKGGLTATLDSPDQGQTGMPVSRLTVDGSTLRAELSYAGAAYEGTLDETGTELSGVWQQGGGSIPLTLHKRTADESFPSVDPEHVGVSSKALDRLTAQVQSLVDGDEIVGGELAVIKNRRTVMRKAFGWSDREAREKLSVDAVYCVRSMTKPLVGTAIQMLIDDGSLALDTPVHEILQSFDRQQTRKITVRHLLTHTSGLPLTTFTRALSDYADLAEVAAEAAETDLLFEPGTRFEYSDAGSDTLGAIVTAVSGMPVERFVQKRILDPLRMENTVTLLGDDPEIRNRVPSAYSGGTGSWSKHWERSDPPLFPLFLTSQSLYSTTADYARFLAWWMDGGEIDSRRLLSSEAVERALAPDRLVRNYPSASDGVDVYYGQQWMVRAAEDGEGGLRRVTFGHDGSDGTHAWVWPEEDLIVLFFTQSRGTMAGIKLEKMVQILLVEHRLDDPVQTSSNPTAEDLEQVAGLYWDDDVAHAYYVITPRGDNLELDRPGGAHMVFKPGDEPGRFVHEARPEIWIEFVRSDDGVVTAMRTFFGKRIEHDPRHVPSDGLPSVDEVIELVRQAHRIDKLPEVGAVRLSGTLDFKDRGMKGSLTSLVDVTRGHVEVRMGSTLETVVINGGRVWYEATSTGVDELAGRRREQALLDQIPVLLGNWVEYYERVEVLKRVEFRGQSLVMVRVVPREGPGSTMFVDETTGRLIRKDDLVQLPGIGIVGVQTLFEDYRDVAGMRIPFRNTSLYRTQLIGRILTKIERAETGVEVAADAFAPLSDSGEASTDRR